MKMSKGFTLLELIVAVSVGALVTASGAITIKQVYGRTSVNNAHVNAVQQVENAGFWISRDAQRAEVINTTNLTGTNLVTMNWTEWDINGNPVYFSVNYTFYNVSANIGRLKRTYSSSNVSGNQQTLIGTNYYYNPGDSNNTSKATFSYPGLTLQLTTIVNQAIETRQLFVKVRPTV